MSSTHSMMHGLQLDNSYGADKKRFEESWLMKSAFLLSGRGCWYDNGRNCNMYESAGQYGENKNPKGKINFKTGIGGERN